MPAEAHALAALQDRLGYRFRDGALLQLALTHSVSEGANNQRLEFLGDALLGAVLADHLYCIHPDWEEGALHVARSALVRQEALARVAVELDLGAVLRVSRNVARSGPVNTQPGVLADAVEALLGAVFLDGGYAAAQGVTLRMLDAALLEPLGPAPAKDAKTRLQEWLQAAGRALPVYTVTGANGRPDTPPFSAECRIGKPPLAAVGTGPSRKAAERAAAECILEQVAAHAPPRQAEQPGQPVPLAQSVTAEQGKQGGPT